jgi:hypothetical protein
LWKADNPPAIVRPYFGRLSFTRNMQSAFFEFFADGVALFHAAVLAVYVAGAVSVLLGRFLVSSLRRWQRAYLAIVFVMAVTIVGGADKCPLTRLENAFRAAGDPAACYSGSYVEHYAPFVPTAVDEIMSIVLLTMGCIGVICAALGQTSLLDSHRERRVHRVSDPREPHRFDSPCPR